MSNDKDGGRGLTIPSIAHAVFGIHMLTQPLCGLEFFIAQIARELGIARRRGWYFRDLRHLKVIQLVVKSDVLCIVHLNITRLASNKVAFRPVFGSAFRILVRKLIQWITGMPIDMLEND